VNTLWATVGSFDGRSVIELKEITHLLGCNLAEASRMAARGELADLNPYKGRDSQKAPWLVNIEDFHKWRMNGAEKARRMAA